MPDQLMKGMMPDSRGDETETEVPKKAEFEGFAECLLFSGPAKITVDGDGLLIAAALDQLPVPYGEITQFTFANYRLEIVTVCGTVTISQMGQTGQWLYNHLYTAYNAAVLKALLVEGSHTREVSGSYSAEENGAIVHGEAVIRLYPDCICVLPAGDSGRRIPFCFVSGMEKGNFSLTLSLLTGERYTFSKLGYGTEPFTGEVTAALRSLRERSLVQLQETEKTLTSLQAAMAAKLMPEGVNAAIGKLSAAAPVLVTGLEKLIKESRIADSYPVLKGLCGEERLFVGMKAPAKEEEQPVPPEMPSLSDNGEETEEKISGPPKPLVWLIAAGSTTAAVELALPGAEAAATYLYRIQGDPETFAMILNRGMEATGFRRELFTLSDEELAKPCHMTEAMLIRRTPALQLMRKYFAGRVIHSGRWQQEMEKHLASGSAPAGTKTTFCTNCGAKLNGSPKFCGECGTKL